MTDFTTLRERFPTLVERAYFATHGFGPLLRETLRDLDDYRRTLTLRNRVVATWYERIVEIRGLLAQLVGAREGDIALGPNATACQASFAAPLVANANGALLDVERVIAAAHDVGAIVVLDAYQAAGIVPIDVRALDVDALVSGTNKWLSSAGMGLAFLYVRRSLANRLAPAFPGWFAHEDPLAYADLFVPAHGARRFEQGAPAVEAIYGARAG